MKSLRRFFTRLRNFAMRRHHDQRLREEIEEHLSLQTEENLRAGMLPGEARRQAVLRLGTVGAIQENCHAEEGLPWIEDLLQDTRYGLRALRKSPGFACVAILTLALGIGANTAIFSVIDAVMLRPLGVRNPAQLVQVGFEGKHGGEGYVGESFSLPTFRELRKSPAFTDVSAFDSFDSLEARPAGSGASTSGESMKAQMVSANFFSVLGLDATLGRTFVSDEAGTTDPEPEAVISFAAWERSFARNPNVLGQKLLIEGAPVTIVGVAPRRFSGVNPGQSYDVWVPLTMLPQLIPERSSWLRDVSTNWLSLIGRLKPGTSAAEARAGLDVLYQQIQKERDVSKWSEQDQQDFFTHHIVLSSAGSGANYLRNDLRRPLLLLMSMVGLVLLVACANVTNLLLARASTRHREIAVRMALGARGSRLLRQLLTESMLMALAAGACGLGLAYGGSRLLVSLMSVTLDVTPDRRILAFSACLSLIAGIAAGLAPALQAARKDQSPALRAGSPRLAHSGSQSRLGRGLVVGQIALSLVVVFAAALLMRTFRNLETMDPGFNRRNVLLFRLDASREGYQGRRLAQLYEQLLERLRSAPGVRSASYSLLTPISGGGWDNYTSVEGYTPAPGENMDVYLNAVGREYFETLSTPLLAGRSFGVQDHPDSTWVAVINQTMAHRFFSGRSAIGEHIGGQKWNGSRNYEIVGVVGDAKYLRLREVTPPTAYLYIPQSSEIPASVTFEVSAGVPSATLVPEIRALLAGVDPRLSMADVKTLAEQIDESLVQERLVSVLSSCFGALALILACIGLYGVMSYAVARRKGEIGIRMALGAAKRNVFRMVIGLGLRLTVIGLAIGTAAALILARLLASFSQLLYGVRVDDPLTILTVSLLMALVAMLACYLPARRAVRVDPAIALRCE